jgi:hypothetical protein
VHVKNSIIGVEIFGTLFRVLSQNNLGTKIKDGCQANKYNFEVNKIGNVTFPQLTSQICLLLAEENEY